MYTIAFVVILAQYIEEYLLIIAISFFYLNVFITPLEQILFLVFYYLIFVYYKKNDVKKNVLIITIRANT